MTTIKRLAVLAAASLLLTACGDDPDKQAAPSLPEDACAQIDIAAVVAQDLGAPRVVTDSVEKADGVTRAHCVWLAPATGNSQTGVTVELVIDATADAGTLEDLYGTAVDKSVAPADWRPGGSIKTRPGTPPGTWTQAESKDFSLLLPGSDVTRLLYFRTARTDAYVARVAVAMDAVGTVTQSAAATADATLAAVPQLFDP